MDETSLGTLIICEVMLTVKPIVKTHRSIVHSIDDIIMKQHFQIATVPLVEQTVNYTYMVKEI